MSQYPPGFSAILCDSLRFSGGCSMLDLEDSHLLENEIFIVNTTEREKEREKKREKKRERERERNEGGSRRVSLKLKLKWS